MLHNGHFQCPIVSLWCMRLATHPAYSPDALFAKACGQSFNTPFTSHNLRPA